ncbi:hypothetical protein XENOCAPTIV_014160, partial [Xenoophorus captivus]
MITGLAGDSQIAEDMHAKAWAYVRLPSTSFSTSTSGFQPIPTPITDSFSFYPLGPKSHINCSPIASGDVKASSYSSTKTIACTAVGTYLTMQRNESKMLSDCLQVYVVKHL